MKDDITIFLNEQDDKVYVRVPDDKETHFEFICTNYFGLTEPEAFMKNAVSFETVMKAVKKNFV
jgi:hypothetical protein